MKMARQDIPSARVNRGDHTRSLRPISFLLLLALCSAASAQQQSTQTPEIMRQLLSGNGKALLQKPIVLNRVHVQSLTPSSEVAPKSMGIPHEGAFWIGESAGQRVLVILGRSLVPVSPQNVTALVRKGDFVDITGTVQRPPDSTTLRALYGLSKSEIRTVQRDGVVVAAGSIVVRGK